MKPDLMVTLLPSMPHFKAFATDPRISGIRLNGATLLSPDTIDAELDALRAALPTHAGWTPIYFDVKGRQLRVVEVLDDPNYLDFRLNHPIQVDLPAVVLFKAGADSALVGRVSEGGYRLTCSMNPRFRVKPGESIHIRHESLRVGGAIFTDAEKERVSRVVASGLISRWFVSYVEEQRDLDEFREMVPDTDEIFLKIESKAGLRFAATQFQKEPGVRLVAACGDLYVEVERPHHILHAVENIIAADPEALVGSRMMLSVLKGPGTYLSSVITRLAGIHPEAEADILHALGTANAPQVPDFADFAQLAWLYRIGYRSFMLCDELCLKQDYLAQAVGAFDAFRVNYCEQP